MKIYLMLLVLLSLHAYSSPQSTSLEDVSRKVNVTLPEVYDSITKLVTTSVENQNFKYHFLVDATEKEFLKALPKVKTQVLKSICKNSITRSILKDHKANIVYSYENTKGQSLGQFMVKPGHCR